MLEVRALPDRIYEVLREQIVTGDLSGDTAVRQDSLASTLGVSKIPVREALTRLHQDGLVTRIPNRGWFVAPLSLQEAEEIYALRLSLEPAAAARACMSATPSRRAAVESAYASLTATADLGLASIAKRNREFHLALVNDPARPLTVQLLERLSLLAERYVLQHLRPEGRGDRARREHTALHAAWLAGSADSVAELLQAHITQTREDLRKQLSLG
jgi:DNA-binding GntR family transcriptional regulator